MQRPYRKVRNSQGFTLIELIFVIVVLGIVGVMGSSFVVGAVRSYRLAETQQQLMQRGRLTLEQMSRELRMALPNSVRVSASGNCVEFMPVVAASRYREPVADVTNNREPANNLSVVPFVLPRPGHHVAVAPLTTADIYTTASPAARVSMGNLAPGTHTSIPLAGHHRFVRNSTSQRVFIAEQPVRFCVAANNLMRYWNYGLSTSALTDSSPGGQGALMAQSIAAEGVAFVLSPGSEERNMAVYMSLRFSRGTSSLALQHQVLVRNVP